MIALGQDCLVFQMSGGAHVPLSADNISVDLLGDTADQFEEDFVQHAANAVFHYFKHDLGRQSVTMAEFAEALEKVLQGFKLAGTAVPPAARATAAVVEADLWRLARESGEGSELFFFPRLREELRRQLRERPRVVRFRQLRSCVKELVGTSRWNPRCRTLEQEIVEFLRQCLSAEDTGADFSLVVE